MHQYLCNVFLYLTKTNLWYSMYSDDACLTCSLCKILLAVKLVRKVSNLHICAAGFVCVNVVGVPWCESLDLSKPPRSCSSICVSQWTYLLLSQSLKVHQENKSFIPFVMSHVSGVQLNQTIRWLFQNLGDFMKNKSKWVTTVLCCRYIILCLSYLTVESHFTRAWTAHWTALERSSQLLVYWVAI